MLHTLAHELVHHIREQNAEGYKVLADFLMEQYGRKGVSVDALVRRQIEKAEASDRKISYAEAHEEVIADSMETMLTDGKAIEKLQMLQAKDPSLFERIKSAIAELIAKIKKAYKNVKPETLEGQIVASMLDEYETIQQMFVKALAGASENFKNAEVTETKNTAEAVKFSIKEMGFEEFDKQTLNNIKMRKGVVLNSISELKSHIERALQNPQEKVNCYLGVISTSVKSKIEEDVGQKLFEENKPYTFVISYDDIQHISEHFNSVDKMVSEVLKVYEIIKDYDSVEFEIGKSNTKKLIFDKSYSDYDYRTVEIVSKSKSSLDLVTFFITKNNIKGSQSVPPATRGSLQRGSASNNTVPQNGTDVKTSISENDVKYSDRDSEGNTLSEAQKEYFKASKVRDETGNLLKVYHGTSADFTVFDRDKIGSTGRFEGSGFNFTPSESRASSYSNNGKVLGGYLNITNPLSTDEKTFSVQRLSSLIAEIDPTGDNIIANYAHNTSDYGTQRFVIRESRTAARMIYDYCENDADIYAQLCVANTDDNALISAFENMGYDGVIHYYDNGKIKTIVSFSSEQFKLSTNKNPTSDADVRYSIREEAKADIKRLLSGEEIRGDIKLTESSPSILYSQIGARNLPLVMKPSHIRENIFTEQEAKNAGLPVNKHIHYHGLGEDLFIKVIDDLDGVTLAYRGAKNAENPARRENYFLLISQHKDEDGNIINVPIYINEHGQYNRVFFDANKIATVFGKEKLHQHIQDEIKKGNLVRIKNRSLNVSEREADNATGYNKKASTDSIHDSSSKSQEKHSDRDLNALTPRNLLANALESSAVHEFEKKKLTEYKANIEKLYANEQELYEVRKKIKELSFAPGKKDTVKIKKLQDKAIKLSNSVTFYDKKLLNLESTSFLKNVLEREKSKAIKRQKEKDAERLKTQKEKALQREKEITERYQASRKKAVESRNKTAMRNKIKRVVNELNQYLLHGTKDKHVMDGMKKVVAEALSILDMDTVGADERVERYNQLIAEATDLDIIASLTETRDRIQGQGDKLHEKLMSLKNDSRFKTQLCKFVACK